MNIKNIQQSNAALSMNGTSHSEKSSGKTSIPKQGEVLLGEVVDLNQSGIKIKLADGQMIDAKLTDAFEFYIGQQVSFLIKESNLEQLLLKPIQGEGDASEMKLQQVLAEAGFVDSEENVSVVKKMLELKMPIDRNTLQKVINLAKQFGYNHIDKILFLVKNNLPANQTNIQQLSKMIDGEHPMLQNLASISQDVASILKDDAGIAIPLELVKGNIEASKAILQIINALQNESAGQELNVSPNENAIQNMNTVMNKIQSDMSKVLPDMNKVQQDINQLQPETVLTINSEEQAKNLKLTDLLSQDTLSRIEKELNFKLAEPKQLNLQSISLDELLKSLRDYDLEMDGKTKVLSNLAKDLSYEIIKKEMLMGKEQLSGPEKLSEYYDQLHEKISNVLELLAQSQDSKMSSVTKEANQLKDSLQFLNDLNQKFNFIQLPMMLGDKLLNSELYIFNEKHQLKNKKGPLTALVRLDLLNLGHLDIHITKTEQNVSIQFFTESTEKIKQVEGHVHKLYNQLNKLGFKVLGITIGKKEKDFNILDDFLQQEKASQPIKRFTFDMRA